MRFAYRMRPSISITSRLEEDVEERECMAASGGKVGSLHVFRATEVYTISMLLYFHIWESMMSRERRLVLEFVPTSIYRLLDEALLKKSGYYLLIRWGVATYVSSI